jgi:hypothetical protein
MVSTHYGDLDDDARLALIKLAEIACKGHTETNVSQMSGVETPKIRLSLSNTDYPFPQMQQKITLKKVPTAQKLGLADADLLAISNALKKLVRMLGTRG